MSTHTLMVSFSPASFAGKFEKLTMAYYKWLSGRNSHPYKIRIERLLPGCMLIETDRSMSPNDLLGGVLYDLGRNGKVPQGLQVYAAVIDANAPYIGSYHQLSSHCANLHSFQWEEDHYHRPVPDWAEDELEGRVI